MLISRPKIGKFMKLWIKRTLQRALGFDRYLFLFAIFTITTLRWNKRERDFIHFINMLPPEGTVLDIGANIGIMSVWLGRKLPGVSILAFEPMPQNIQTLKRVLQHYKMNNVRVISKALGNESGRVEMVMPVLDEVQMQGLSHVVHDSIESFNEGNFVSAKIIKLDECEEVKTSPQPLTAIKLDVENFEYFVLEGGRKTIERHKPLIYTELWENENRDKCFVLLAKLGYHTMVLSENSLVQFEPSKHRTQNFFFVPFEKAPAAI